VVTFITYFVEINFGKTAGTIALVVVAVIIAAYLYRKEIMAKFKRK
jgi:cbb3-type cytochrome oxidase subunit 3